MSENRTDYMQHTSPPQSRMGATIKLVEHLLCALEFTVSAHGKTIENGRKDETPEELVAGWEHDYPNAAKQLAAVIHDARKALADAGVVR